MLEQKTSQKNSVKRYLKRVISGLDIILSKRIEDITSIYFSQTMKQQQMLQIILKMLLKTTIILKINASKLLKTAKNF